MFKIISKKMLAANIFEMKIEAPLVAKSASSGQFIILRIDEFGERIPLTVADSDSSSVTVVFLVVGHSTEQLSKLEVGDFILDFVGPLGNKSEINNFGTVVLVGGGCGVAPVFPQARDFKKAGNKVIIIAGFRSKDLVFWEDKLREVCDELIITTDDGSYGRKGFAAHALKEIIDKENVDRVIIVGPPIMMKFTSLITKEKNIPTIVSINSIMVDGMGMCGACRVVVDGKTRFACVDGPEFDASKVDFDELMNRNSTYLDEEKAVTEKNHKVCY